MSSLKKVKETGSPRNNYDENNENYQYHKFEFGPLLNGLGCSSELLDTLTTHQDILNRSEVVQTQICDIGIFHYFCHNYSELVFHLLPRRETLTY